MTVDRPTGRRALALSIAAFMLASLLPLATPAAAAAAVLAPPTLTAPASGDTVSGNPVFTWTAVSAAVKYHIEISASPSFSSPIFDDTANLRYTPTTELPLGTLYWRVAARDATNTSGTYASDSFVKAWDTAPNPTTPTEGALLSFPTDPLLFAWDAFAGAQSYELQTARDPAFTNDVKTYATKNTSFVVPEPMTVGQTFYWHVHGVSGTLDSAWSATHSFSVEWPTVPALVYPANGQELPDVYLDWDPVPGASTYELQVSPDGDWANNLTFTATVKGTRYAPPSALNNGNYFWRVRAHDAASSPNNGGWSAERQFERSWLSRPVLLGPTNHNYSVAIPTFSWTPVDHAAYYQFQYSLDPNFGTSYSCYTNHTRLTPYTRIVGTGEPNNCTLVPVIGATYYWHVRGIDPPVLNPGAGEPGVLGLWSNTTNLDVWSFAYIPDNPVPLGPTNGSTVDVPTLRWVDATGATKYQVTIVNAAGTTAATGTTYATSWTPPTLLDFADGPFHWYVQSYDYATRLSLIPAEGSWWSFILSAPAPVATAPEQIGPADLSSSVMMPSLSWEPVVGANRYQVWYSSNGTAYFQLGVDTRNSAETFATSNLPAGNYLWYVRALNAGGGTIGTSSSLRTFVINEPSLQGTSDYLTPAKCLPGGGCPAIADTPTLSWNSVPFALGYTVYVAEDPNFTNIYRTYSTAFTELTPRESYLDNQAAEAYYWFVRPVRSDNTGRYDSQAQQNASAFQKRSEGIHRTSPVDGAHVPNEITFQWEDYLSTNQGLTPAVTQEARQYRIQTSRVADFATTIDTKDVDTPFYTPFDRTYPEGQIFWRVQAIDGSQNTLTMSTSGNVWKDLPLVALTLPTDGGHVPGVPYLQWTPQAFAASYNLQLDEDPNFSSPIVATTKMSAWAYTDVLTAGTYYWRVQRNDADALDGPWSAQPSAARSFVLEPDAPTLTSPANGANPSPTTLLLQWTSTRPAPKYTVELSTVSDFASTVIGFPVTTVMTSWAPKTLLGNGTYFWRVKALNASGTAVATSSAWSFTIDSTRPSVTALSPASSPAITSAFTVTFSEAVTGVDGTTFVVSAAGSGTALPGALSILSPTSARFTPAAMLIPGQTYTVAVTSGVTDLVGNPVLPYSSNVRASTTVQQDSPAVREAWGRWATAAANGGAMKMARTASSKLTFSFSGTDVSLVGYRGPSGGYASVYLDGVLQTSTLSFYGPSNQFRRTLWSKPGLVAGAHTLQVVTRGTKPARSKDAWVYVDAFLVGGVTYQESDATVRELFRPVSSTKASGASYDVASHVAGSGRTGASLTFQFNGTGVSWYATKTAASGKATVYIDNVRKGTVDLYRSGTAYKQKVWTSATLSNRLHTIRIVALGTKQSKSRGYDVSFDSFVIR